VPRSSRSQPPEPTSAELQVLGVLWDWGPKTAKAVLDLMPDGKRRSYTTVLSMMQQMEKKGLLSRTLEGRAHVYSPATTRRKTLKPMLKSLVSRAFGGRSGTAVQHLLSDQPPSAAEIEEIRRLLDKIERDSPAAKEAGDA